MNMNMNNDYDTKYIKYKKKYLKKMINNKYIDRTISNNTGNNMNYYTESISEPWYTLISLGLKKVEGRKNNGRFMEMKIGDVIEWTNNNFKPRSVKTKVINKSIYESFTEYLNNEGLQNCLPGIPSLEHGLSVYYKYYTPEDEQKYGVVAIRLELV